MAGATRPDKLMQTNLRESPFLNVFRYFSVRNFSKEDSMDLIKRPTYGIIQYSENALDVIYTSTGGQPYLLQYICMKILDYCSKSKVLEIDSDTIKNITEDFLNNEFYYFDHLWSQLDRRQKSVAIISSKLSPDRRYFSIKELLNALKGRKDLITPREIKDIEIEIDDLVDLGILTPSEPKNFTFSIGMFAEWIKRNEKRFLRDNT